jgi:phage baseplate assembly protein V
MPGQLLESVSKASTSSKDHRIFGVALAQVINNIDANKLGRVQLSLPWLPDFQPWARVAVPQAGKNCGFFFIPQIGDEVLVVFNQGDVREPYVIGCLWNGEDPPPVDKTEDPIYKRTIRSLNGNQIEIDDLSNSITINTNSEQKIVLDPDKIVISNGSTKITLESDKLTLEAPEVQLKGTTSVSIEGVKTEVKGSGTLSLKADGTCEIKGSLVKIN